MDQLSSLTSSNKPSLHIVHDVKEYISRLSSQQVDSLGEQISDKKIHKELRGGISRTWKSQMGNQDLQPLFYFEPVSLFDGEDGESIGNILTKAVHDHCQVKAVGSGLSYSDCTHTNDYLVDLCNLNRVSLHKNVIEGGLNPEHVRGEIPLADKPVKWNNYNPEENRRLVEVEGGITIKKLNKDLEKLKLGLMNAGGFDGQTLAGVVSTSTHGSGIKIGPFSDMVKSMVLATTSPIDKTIDENEPVYFYRIEPANGITNPKYYRHESIRLVQNDDLFYSVICSMGCMGIIYSLVIEVMQQYWLEETKFETNLEQLYDMLDPVQPTTSNPKGIPPLLNDNRHVELLIHPYPINEDDGDVIEMDQHLPPRTYYKFFKVLVTLRNIVEIPNTITQTEGGRDPFQELISSFKFPFEASVALLNKFPLMKPGSITSLMNGMTKRPYTNKSHKIFKVLNQKDLGFAAEIGFSMEEKRKGSSRYQLKTLKAAIRKTHRIAQKARIKGQVYHTMSLSLRFVAGSKAHLSMMQGADTCMIEFITFSHTYGGVEMMRRYENSFYEIGGRTHWGLDFDVLNGNNHLLHELYPSTYDTWKHSYKILNKKKTFNNSFTNRMGFSRSVVRGRREVNIENSDDDLSNDYSRDE